MKSVIFHGILKAFGKKPCKIKADSWNDVCAYLQANVRNYQNIRRKILEDVPYCYFLIDGEMVEGEDDLKSKFSKASQIEVVPAVVQAGEVVAIGILKFVLMTAASFAISYVITKLMTPKDPKQLKTSSYIISSKTNIAARNTPIPIGYGRLRVAPPVINVLEINRDLNVLEADKTPNDTPAGRNDPANRRCQGKQWQTCLESPYYTERIPT